MRIGLLGDTHGNFPWMLYAINKFVREGIDTVIQLGDLGIWPGQHSALGFKRINQTLQRADQTWYVVPGNHEDYNQIDAVPIREDGLQRWRSNILLLPRGHRWEWGGMSFVALGGAPSVDRARRARNRSWWPQEFITEEDVAKVAAGGYADVMVAHDAPLGVSKIDLGIAGNPLGFTKDDLTYAYQGRLRMTDAFEAVKPKFFFHGHYHFPVNEFVGDTHVIGLTLDDGQGFRDGAMGELDTETGQAVVWDLKADYHQHRWGRAERIAQLELQSAPPRGWEAFFPAEEG